MLTIALLVAGALADEGLPPFASPPTAIAALSTGELLVAQGNGCIVVLDQESGQSRKLGESEKPWATLKSGAIRLSVDPTETQLLAVRGSGHMHRFELYQPSESETSKTLLPAGKLISSLKIQSYKYGGTRVVWNRSGSHFATWAPAFRYNSAQGPAQVWTRDGKLAWSTPYANWICASPTADTFAVLKGGALLLQSGDSVLRTFEFEGIGGCAVFSPDGSSLAFSKSNGDLWFLDSDSFEVTLKSDTHRLFEMAPPFWAMRLEWSPNDLLLGVSTAECVVHATFSFPGAKIHWNSSLQTGMMGVLFELGWTHSNHFLGGTVSNCYKVDMATMEKTQIGSRTMRDVVRSPNKPLTFVHASHEVFCLSGPDSQVLWRRSYKSGPAIGAKDR